MGIATPIGDIALQHLIDPEICIRCNTCEEACPVDAITHDARNYVVDFAICNHCKACVPPCPTGAIDNWRELARAHAYAIEDQLTWDELPPQADLGAEAGSAGASVPAEVAQMTAIASASQGRQAAPPWSAAHPYVGLYTLDRPATATVTGNFRLTADDASSDIHHIVLDFGTTAFPVLEGQSIGIIPPGTDANGRAHHIRLYSVASPRDGERPNYNNVALTVKRVTEDHDGRPVRGVASNFLCDLKKGDGVTVVGPYGTSFLMPNHPNSSILMICTGTGSAPMRAMTERRRRRRDIGGKLTLFFGARRPEELPYFGPLMKLPKDFIDIHLAFSRDGAAKKTYVQDLIVERADEVMAMIEDENCFIYLCGLKRMEAGVDAAFREICAARAKDWPSLRERLVAASRLHIETY